MAINGGDVWPESKVMQVHRPQNSFQKMGRFAYTQKDCQMTVIQLLLSEAFQVKIILITFLVFWGDSSLVLGHFRDQTFLRFFRKKLRFFGILHQNVSLGK